MSRSIPEMHFALDFEREFMKHVRWGQSERQHYVKERKRKENKSMKYLKSIVGTVQELTAYAQGPVSWMPMTIK